MKPDWKDAPEWAMWLAQDCNGDWYWFEEKPHAIGYGDAFEWYANGTRCAYAGNSEREPEARPS